ncbi:MAG: DNA-methyltransferase [Aristaeellaceae bacterium]
MFEQVQAYRETTGAGENLLLCGDSALPLPELTPYLGKVQCVYIDPPFMTGDTFTRRRRYGVKGWRTGDPAPAYPAYDDTCQDKTTYIAQLRGMVEQAHRLLAPTGMMLLHLDWRMAAYARLLCDEVFGEKRFLNEIIWAYESGGRAKHYFSRKHDVILLYARSPRYRFDLTRVPLERTATRSNHMRRAVDEQGRSYRSIRSGGKVYRYYDDEPVYPGDVWTDISHLQQRDPERTGFTTQKPMKLLERLLRPVVLEGDVVCDLCCGSGTTLAVAQKLGCRVIGVDKSPETLMIARSRLSADNLTLLCPSTMDEALLEANYAGNMLLLTGFDAQHPQFPVTELAFDRLESWAAGYWTDKGMVALQHFQRTVRHPELPLLCVLSDMPGELAVSTVDAAGRRRTYRWHEE